MFPEKHLLSAAVLQADLWLHGLFCVQHILLPDGGADNPSATEDAFAYGRLLLLLPPLQLFGRWESTARLGVGLCNAMEYVPNTCRLTKCMQAGHKAIK
jgi:hypothetical protein